ncbi:DUF6918 family protein [Pseudonocardia sp. GCM10023141]|uniref:DUF6918 family protein n=1 Tax=Pseudonocardia sp. GCM10023141 TaxID=3252653 RepID=UPI00361113ED
MTATLSDTLLRDDRRTALIDDLTTVVDQEVSDKHGVSGAVIKTAYAAAKKMRPGLVPGALNRMLDDFVVALDPMYGDYRAAGGAGFGPYLVSRSDEASEALLSVSDGRAQRTSMESLRKVYEKLRPTGRKNVAEALPRLGAVIEQHATAG